MNGKIIAKELQSELMLYDPERDEVHLLNATARRIYQMHREGKDLTEIEQAIRASFQVEEEQDLHGHIRKCLGELGEKGLITAGEGFLFDQ